MDQFCKIDIKYNTIGSATEIIRKIRALAAIQYLPPYEIHFEKSIYEMPGCMIAIYIDKNLKLSNPEIIADSGRYEHPFVYRDTSRFGQKICLGSYYNSNEENQVRHMSFPNQINHGIKLAIDLLKFGYNRHVCPANGHLHSSKYEKYKKKK